VAESIHARLYNGIPPVRRQRWHWLVVSAVVVIACAAIAVPVWAIAYATHSVPSGWWGGGGRTSGGNAAVFEWSSVAWIGSAFIVGGLLGVSLPRRWWNTLALYVVGFALWIVTLHASVGDIYAWFFWIFGVSAGVGIRGLIDHGRRRTAALSVGIPLLAVIVFADVGIASYEERRPRWPGYRGGNEHFYFGVTPWWVYAATVVLSLLGVALAVLLYRGSPRRLERRLVG
jgi:hypothetical protein